MDNKFLTIVKLARTITFLQFATFILMILTKSGWLGLFLTILLLAHALIPGFFLLLKLPRFAYAWVAGYKFWTSLVPWDSLSFSNKLSIYFLSIVFFIAATILIAIQIQSYLR